MYWLQDLLTPISDARFHFGRKLTTTDISVLHQVINDDEMIMMMMMMTTSRPAPTVLTATRRWWT